MYRQLTLLPNKVYALQLLANRLYGINDRLHFFYLPADCLEKKTGIGLLRYRFIMKF